MVLETVSHGSVDISRKHSCTKPCKGRTIYIVISYRHLIEFSLYHDMIIWMVLCEVQCSADHKELCIYEGHTASIQLLG